MPPGSLKSKSLALALCLSVMTASSCYDDTAGTQSLAALSFIGSAVDSEALEYGAYLEEGEIGESVESAPDGEEIQAAPDETPIPGAAPAPDQGGVITVDFNVPSMRNAKVYGFLYDSRGSFRGEFGYGGATRLVSGRNRSEVMHATSDYLYIHTGAVDRFAPGNYTVHGKFDLDADGFDGTRGDRGFRVDFAVKGDTIVKVREDDLVDPCHETIAASNRVDLKYATIYVYMYFPGGDPLKYYACRYDGGTSYVKLNHYGNDLGNNMTRDLNSGVYDVLIIADMDDSIEDPEEPALSNGDRFILIRGMIIDGTAPIDISDYVFATYIADILPAPEVRLEVHANAIDISFRNVPGAVSYNIYGRAPDGYSLIGTAAGGDGDALFYFTDFGPDDRYYAGGLPSAMDFYYSVSAVDGRGNEGEASPWVIASTGGVEAPVIYGDRVEGREHLELAVSVPPYCREIEITAQAGSCGGEIIGTYSFPVGPERRDRGSHFPLSELSPVKGMVYGFTVRGRDLYGSWSEPGECYLYAY